MKNKYIDYYNYESQLNTVRKSIQNHQKISNRNKELLSNFEKQLLVNNLSKPRIIKYLTNLRIIATNLNKNFDELTKNDIMDYVAHVNSLNRSEWTKHSYKVVVKRFFKWLKGFEDKREYPEEVSWIRATVSRNSVKLPNEGELLDEMDIKNMINKALNFRDKALIATLWESGTRIGELATITIKDITFDKYGAYISIDGKTGPRKLRLISSVPYLSQWLSLHPFKENRDAYFWITMGNNSKEKLASHDLVTKVLKELAIKCGIKKKVNPHSFRHSRATFLANYLTEFQMNQYFGWVQGSKMPSTYVHLSGKNTDEALLKLNGIIPKEEHKKSILQPIICQRCNAMNQTDNKFCSRCSGVLDLKTAIELENEQTSNNVSMQKSGEYLDNLFKDPEVISLFIQKIKEMEVRKQAFEVR